LYFRRLRITTMREMEYESPNAQLEAPALTANLLPDPLTLLPFEIVEQIFKHLEIPDIIGALAVNKSWRSVAQSSLVWRHIFLNNYSAPAKKDPPYLKMGGNGVGKSDPRAQQWHKMTKARYQLEKNWKTGTPRAIYYSGHTDSVYCCQFDEDKIITGSRDRTIRVWDVNTYKCLKVIGGPNARPALPPLGQPPLAEHTSVAHSCPSVNGTSEGDSIYHVPTEWHDASILCLQYDDEIMVTGSSDATCIVWDVKTFQVIRRLRHHTGGVLDICFDKKYIISCSKDSKIAVWSRETGALLQTLSGHKGPVNAVQMRGSFLVSASGDGMSKLWDLNKMREHRSFASRDRGLAAVEFSDDGRAVLAGGNDMVIYKYDIQSGNMCMQYSGHQALVRSLFLDFDNRRVLSGSYDQGMRVFDYDSGAEVGQYNNWTTSWILSAKCDYRRIVATSQDGRVLVMDFGYGIENIDLLSGTAAKAS
jgi:F-box and WD-40 domain protein 1/11